jgi:DNA-binding PadR family transcriptional regulator
MPRQGSSDNRLLILGLLRTGEMHGYQIAETIDTRFGDTVRVKKPTLYDALKRLRSEGRVVSREEQEGNRPLRTVYSITPEGEREFMDLLRASIGAYREPDLPGDIALMFIGALAPREARLLLLARGESLLTTIEDMLATTPQDPARRVTSSRRALHMRAESDWLEEMLATLSDDAAEEPGG